jgi:TonB family protein
VVHLVVTIAPDGSVTNLEVIGGHPLLVPSAMEAVRQWRYAPVPAATVIVADVNFVLPDAAPNSLAQQLDHAARPEIPGRIRMSPTVQAAKLVQRIEPVYPQLAKAARLDGTVQLAVTIASDGHVTHAEPVSGHPLLVAAAIEAVKQWQYQPTLLNGVPVEISTTVDLIFSLK